MRPILTALAASAALMTAAAPASAATLIDTGVGQTSARPVNPTTTLLGQFTLDHASIIDSIQNYGRVVTAGDAVYSIYSSVGGQPGALLYSATTSLDVGKIGFTGIDGIAFNLLAGTYFVGYGQASPSFTAYVFGGAPNPLGIEGSFKPKGYVATNGVDLDWLIGGNTIAAVVPEPAVWAMIVGGFGLIGGMVRRRRRMITHLA